MRKLAYILVILVVTSPLHATEKDRKDPKYPVNEIDEALKENAHVVIRRNDITFIINSRSKTVIRQHAAYTIFNDKGEDYALLVEGYDGESKITEFEAWAFDERGEELDKLKNSDIEDHSAVSGFSLYEDNRLKYADMTQPDYPYTVEFITEITYDKYYGIPDFQPIRGSNVAVEESSLTVLAPEGLMPRYREVRFEGEKVQFNRDGKQGITWKVAGMKAVEREPFSRGLRELVPYVQLAPTKFEYSGYAGDMSSWKSFGEWIWMLNEGRDKLPAGIVNEVKQLTEGMSDREKIRAVYEFMQNRTRYVSIQLGIGGLQPFGADVVNNVGYGDCKALSNYTVSLLKEVGVKSYYTLVEAGPNPTPVTDDFPNDPFNHVIVCVPMEQDTVWLECTSQINPFNYLGTFTSDRKVLVVTEEGGKLVKTPKYRLEDNQRIRRASVKMDDMGNALVDVTTAYHGLHYDVTGLEFRVHEGREEQKKWIHKNTEIANYDLVSFEMENVNREIPAAIVKMQLDLPRYASRTGKRFYFVPNLMNRLESQISRMEDRKTDIISKYDMVYMDSVEYSFPSNYQVEYLPEPVSFESEFGRYESRSEFIQGKLMYIRKLEIFSGEYDPGKYDAFIDFVEEVESHDNAKVVFTTKT